jgi:hypothetical protein
LLKFESEISFEFVKSFHEGTDFIFEMGGVVGTVVGGFDFSMLVILSMRVTEPFLIISEAQGICMFRVSWRCVPSVRTCPGAATLIRRAAVLGRMP